MRIYFQILPFLLVAHLVSAQTKPFVMLTKEASAIKSFVPHDDKKGSVTKGTHYKVVSDSVWNAITTEYNRCQEELEARKVIMESLKVDTATLRQKANEYRTWKNEYEQSFIDLKTAFDRTSQVNNELTQDNERLQADLDKCLKKRTPVFIVGGVCGILLIEGVRATIKNISN